MQSRNCHTWTAYLSFRLFFERNVGQQETQGTFSLPIKSTFTLFVKIVTGKFRHVRQNYWSLIFGGNTMVQRMKNLSTFPYTVKWSEDVEPGLSRFLPTVV